MDIFAAINANNIAKVNELIASGNINSRNNVTPLMWASGNQNLEAARALIAHGVDINAIDSNGRSALFWATTREDVEMVSELLARGANPNIIDRFGKTVSMYTRNRNILGLLPPPIQRQQQIQIIQELAPLRIKLTDSQLADYNNNSCTICLDKFKDRSITLLNPCAHSFHTECIANSINLGRNTCPNCRVPIASKQLFINDTNNTNTGKIFFGGGINFIEKYKKYKIKYLSLKGGAMQLDSPPRIRNIPPSPPRLRARVPSSPIPFRLDEVQRPITNPIIPTPESYVAPPVLPINRTECSICLNEKNYNIDVDYVNRVKILRCGHTFHHGCITEHFNNDNKFCPLCRKAADETSSIFLGGGSSTY